MIFLTENKNNIAHLSKSITHDNETITRFLLLDTTSNMTLSIIIIAKRIALQQYQRVFLSIEGKFCKPEMTQGEELRRDAAFRAATPARGDVVHSITFAGFDLIMYG